MPSVKVRRSPCHLCGGVITFRNICPLSIYSFLSLSRTHPYGCNVEPEQSCLVTGNEWPTADSSARSCTSLARMQCLAQSAQPNQLSLSTSKRIHQFAAEGRNIFHDTTPNHITLAERRFINPDTTGIDNIIFNSG